MNYFNLSAKFYILITLILIIPATYLSYKIQDFLLSIQAISPTIKQLSEWGIIQIPTGVAILIGLLFLLENYLWKLKFVNKIFVLPPDINGRFEGEIESSFNNNKHDIVIEIKQKLFSISINLYTNKSSSYSFVASIDKDSHDYWNLYYAYTSDPITISDDADMNRHDGFAIIKILDNGKKIDGYYFNNPRYRGTHGNITCSLKGKRLNGQFYNELKSI
jgi:hypothetical protein